MDFQKLINMGYTATDILGGISKSNHVAANKIKKALSLGYSASTILSKLSGGRGEDDEKFYTLEQQHDENIKKSQRKDRLKALGLLAGVVGGAGALASGLGRSAASTAAEGVMEIPSSFGEGSDFPGATTTVTSNPIPVSAYAHPGIEKAKKTLDMLQGKEKVSGFAPGSIPEESISPFQSNIAENIEGVSKLHQLASRGEPNLDIDVYKTKTGTGFPQVIQFIEKHRDAGKSAEETNKLLKSSKFYAAPLKRLEEETQQDSRSLVDKIYGSKTKSISAKSTGKKELIDNVAVLKDLFKGLRGT